MAKRSNGKKSFHNEDLLLEVSSSVDRRRWDENRYEPFIDELCQQDREYQKKALRTALRYLLGGEYSDLRDLAMKNYQLNAVLRDKYGSSLNLEGHLQLPDQLSASLDLATGTGKSFVAYGLAAVMLAEGAVDRVLLLCPSTTIESGLYEKFKLLAGRADLRDLLPHNAVINAPKIINATESIVPGCICIENYHAILTRVSSSIRDSLKDNGARTLIINDEAHHVANEAKSRTKKWKEFLTDPVFGFRYLIGLSGTCYVGNEYFSDVIFRYPMRQAMEEKSVKKVKYVAEMPKTRQSEQEKWQLVLNRHLEIKRKLNPRNLLPLTIVITRDIQSCIDTAESFKTFLKEETNKTRAQIEDSVLIVHSDAPDLVRLPSVNSSNSKVEWVFSVSMLTEGWDVKRVFQIVPHEKRAFDSKLLIAQVLGRGLRIPDGWKGPQPEVIVFNHDRWAEDIRQLVLEVMEFEKRIPSFPIETSQFNFDLLNIKYDPKPRIEKYPMDKKYKLFSKGYISLATQTKVEEMTVEFEDADTGVRSHWKTKIKHATFSPSQVASVMYQRFEDLPDEDDRSYYMKQFPISKLEEIIKLSLKKSGNTVITDSIRQKFLQSMGTLQRKNSHTVRYDFDPTEYFKISTIERPQESVNASALRNGKTLYYTSQTKDSIPDEYREFFDEATEEGSGYKCINVPNHYDFKSCLNAVIADHGNERKFIKELVNPENIPFIQAWIKSTGVGFYTIDYFWKKGEHPKRGKFNPDFFIKANGLMLVVEIKDDEQINDPSTENLKKSEYAFAHFNRINGYLGTNNIRDQKYKFNFLTPNDFNRYFQHIREGNAESFISELDASLS